MSEVRPWEWNWSAIAAFSAAAVALYGAWRANKIAQQNLSASIDLEIFKLKERQLSQFRDAFAAFAASASAIRKDGAGHFFQEDVAKCREFSSKLVLFMNPDEEDYELLRLVIADELGVSSREEKLKIGSEHLYTVGQRILSRKAQEIEKEIRRYNAKNK